VRTAESAEVPEELVLMARVLEELVLVELVPVELVSAARVLVELVPEELVPVELVLAARVLVEPEGVLGHTQVEVLCGNPVRTYYSGQCCHLHRRTKKYHFRYHRHYGIHDGTYQNNTYNPDID